MAIKIQFRRDTSSNWTSANPVLAQGEFGLETNTSQFKIGNGTTAWASLPYGGIAGPAQTNSIQSFGDGSGGTVTLTSGTTTLTNDYFPDTLTISGTATIVTSGFRIFCKTNLDLSNAPAGAIKWNGTAGGNSTTSGAGAASSALTSANLGRGVAGGAGAAGTTTNGASGAGGTAAAISNGGSGGQSAAGGAGSGGTGGAAAGGGTASNPVALRRYETNFIRGVSLIEAGAGGRGGSSGGGDTVNSGRGGGGGGGGAGTISIYTKLLTRGASTAASCIQAIGGAGGNGGGTPTGNTGGGSGGGGGGGGYIYLCYEALAGTAATDLLVADGGAAGNSSNGSGTGLGASGSTGGNGGVCYAFCSLTNTGAISSPTAGSAGTAAAGTAGGTGGSGGVSRLTV